MDVLDDAEDATDREDRLRERDEEEGRLDEYSTWDSGW